MAIRKNNPFVPVQSNKPEEKDLIPDKERAKLQEGSWEVHNEPTYDEIKEIVDAELEKVAQEQAKPVELTPELLPDEEEVFFKKALEEEVKKIEEEGFFERRKKLEDERIARRNAERPADGSIQVAEELRAHYDRVIEARDSILFNPEANGASVASVLNATTSMLKELVKLQMEAHNADTIARIQQAIFNALEDASPEFKQRVLDLLEVHLETV